MTDDLRAVLLSPRSWFPRHAVNPTWDRELNTLLDLGEHFIVENDAWARIGPYRVGINDHPRGSFTYNHKTPGLRIQPLRVTMMRAYRHLLADCPALRPVPWWTRIARLRPSPAAASLRRD